MINIPWPNKGGWGAKWGERSKRIRTLFKILCMPLGFVVIKLNILVLFNVVRFDNGECNATDTESGLCYTHAQCDEKGNGS